MLTNLMQIRIYHGKLVEKLHNSCMQPNEDLPLSNRYFQFSILESTINSISGLISDCENILKNQAIRDQFSEIANHFPLNHDPLNNISGDIPTGPRDDHEIRQPATELFEKVAAKEQEDAYQPVLVNFYAHWCGFSKKLMPVWDQLEKELDDVKVVKMECTKKQNFCRRFGVAGYPTIILFHKDKMHTYSDGNRSFNKIKAWVDEITKS